MNIDLNCPSCTTRLRIRAGAVGRKLKCPKCGVPFQIPTQDRSPAPTPPGLPLTVGHFGEQSDPPAETFQFLEEPNRNSVVGPSPGETSEANASPMNWLIAGCLLTVILAVGVGAVWIGMNAGGGSLSRSRTESRLTKDNFLKISLGMPREDVLLILGPPTKNDFVSIPFISLQNPGYIKTYDTWEKDGRRIEIQCTTSGNSHVAVVTRKEQSGLD